MANHLSAKKRATQSKTRYKRNHSLLARMRNVLKKVENLIQAKEASKASDVFKEAQAVVAKTAQKGIIHKNSGARKLSRVSARIKKL